MKTRRTPWWQYVIGAVLGLLAGIGLASYGESSGLSLIGAPWIVPGLLAVLGVIVLILALQVHKYANTDPKKRPHSFINPTIAVYTLVLAKALGLAGATLAGWYGGQIVMLYDRFEAPFFRHIVLEGIIAPYRGGFLCTRRHRVRNCGRGVHRRHDHRHYRRMVVPATAERRPRKPENQGSQAP